MDYSTPGSSVHEIFQAKILEWVAISFSRGSSPPRDQTWVSCTAGRFFTNWATREANPNPNPGGSDGKKSACNVGDPGSISGLRRSHGERNGSQSVLVVKNLPVNAGDLRDAGLIPGSGRSPGGGHDNPLQYSCLENPMDRGVWQATVHRVMKSQIWLKWLSTHTLRYPGKNSKLLLTLDLQLYYNISRMILIIHESNCVIFCLKTLDDF